jgi:uncharacterized protein HemX
MQIRAQALSRISSRSLLTVVVTLLTLTLGGCTMNETQQRTGTGAALGAIGGALIGGNREGALIGAAVGAAGGYMVDQHKKREETSAENAALRAENERLQLEAENARLRQELNQ